MTFSRFYFDHCTRVVVFLTWSAVLLVPGSAVWAQESAQTAESGTSTGQQASLIAAPEPGIGVAVNDTPNDDGKAIDISWTPSAREAEGRVDRYLILRATADLDSSTFSEIGEVPAGSSSYRDGSVVEGVSYFYKVAAVQNVAGEEAAGTVLQSESEPVGPVVPTAQWFDFRRINVFVGVLLLSGFIIYYILQARSGKELFIRKIAGLEAVDEAVGRATEMGRKIYFIPGSQDLDQVQTIAGITILGRVAQMSAQYETWLEVPVSRSLVMVTSREVVKEAYARAGRPDSFREAQVHYITDDQFGYAAALDGMIVREKPATIFLMGLFYAESLILAETGNSVGAIQIAGTGEPSQLPFFVAACDYTLIGEELFAASAYLSREPRQLGSLKGQDIGKALILVAIIVGILLETFYLFDFSRLFRVIE